MLYMIFQYGRKPVLIQQILIGFDALLEKNELTQGTLLSGNLSNILVISSPK